MPENNRIDTTGISYRKFGSGPVIILLHGFPGSGMLWRNIWDDLSVSHTVIVPDLPGTGYSVLNGTPGINDMADMIKEIADKETSGQVVLAGHSMGGYFALAFAKAYPDKVAGLSLVHSTTAADDEEKIKTRQKAIELIMKGGKKQFISQMVPNLFSETFKAANPDILQKQVEQSLELTDVALINFYQAMIDRTDTTEVLDTAAFPVQWICGVDDTVIPCKKILEKTNRSNVNFVYFYNDCGHMSMLEAPERLTADLKELASFSFGN